MAELVGRDRPRAILRSEVERTIESHGGLVVVAGEAGIGKTALVAAAADDARRGGALVASGTTWDREGAPGYWPWMQVLRGLRRELVDDAWAAARRAAGPATGLLLGEQGSGLGVAIEGDFALADAVTTLLVTVSQDRPVVVVIDDLHWADPASVRLLEFVARHAWFERLLLVATYRDAEVVAGNHPLADAILPLVAKATAVTLTGLDRDGVRALLTRAAGRTPPDDVVDAVHRRTGGNPFFVDQTAQLWQATGAVDALGPGVREAVARRLDLLAGPVRGLLTAAAVLGREVDRDVLAATAGLPAAEVDALLARAAAARLVTVQGGRVAFVHDLVRETIAEGLDAEEARRRHAAVVRAFADHPELAERRVPADLAHHAYEAVPEVPASEAIDLLVAAARVAGYCMSTEESVGHYRRAVSLVRADEDLRAWASLNFELAGSLLGSNELSVAAETYVEVAAAARKLDDPQMLALVGLGLRGLAWLVDPAGAGPQALALIAEAHAVLVGDESTAVTDIERERELAARCVELARQADDTEALLQALVARADSVWVPGRAAERLAIADEVAVVTGRAFGDVMAWYASMIREMALVELGDPRHAEEHRTFVGRVERMGADSLDHMTLWSGSSFAARGGRFDDARAMLEEAYAVGKRRIGDRLSDWVVLILTQHWTVALDQGRWDEADALTRTAAAEGHPCPGLLRAITDAERGDLDAARRYHDAVAGTDAEPTRWFAPQWLRLRAQVAAASRDAALRDAVRAELAPLSGMWAVLFGGSLSGPFDHWRATVDAGAGDVEAAVSGFRAALAQSERLGAPHWAAVARVALAEALAGRGAGDDDAEAARLLADGEREAAALGMLHVAHRARGARAAVSIARAAASAEAAPAPAGPAAPANAFRREGGVWELTFAGETVHVPDAKGLRDLHVLLGRPGVDVRAVDLLDPAGGEAARAARSRGGDPVLDEQARAAYRARLTTLDDEIDRATLRHDDRRAARLDAERAALLDELRRATGLGGRSRRLGDDAERARKAVSERIRDTLRRLDDRHPRLAAHLREAVSTGSSCAYRPPADTSWAL